MTGVMVGVFSALAGIVGAVTGDLLSEEIRRRLDRLPVQLIRLACRRLPEPSRTDRAGEWCAELDVILASRGATRLPITRLMVGMRFALGLCIATPALRPARPRRPRWRVALLMASPLLMAVAVPSIFAINSEMLLDYSALTVFFCDALMLLLMIRMVATAVRVRKRLTTAAAFAVLPFAVLYTVDLVRRLGEPIPVAVSTVGLAVLMVQPILILRFTRELRRPSGAMERLTWFGCSAAVLATILAPRPVPVYVLLVVGAIAALQWAMGISSVRSSLRCDSGERRARMMMGGVATSLFGIAVANLVLGAAAFTGPEFQVAGRVSAVLAGCGYLLVAAPPTWLRLPWGPRTVRS